MPQIRALMTGFAAALVVAVSMPAPSSSQVVASDNFNRANETPFATGGNWGRVIAGNFNGFSNLINQQVSAGSNEGIYYWQGAGTFSSTAQFARARVVQNTGEGGLVLLGGSDQSIMVSWGPPGVDNTVYIYWYSQGQDRGQLATGPSSVNNGDIIEAVLVGGVISAKVNGATVLSVANTTTLTSGKPGFITYLDPNIPSFVQKLDDWEAGTPQSYTISGTILESGNGLGGVQVAASGGFTGTTTTAGNGTYTLSGVSPGTTSIVLTPTLAGHTMTPTTRTVAGPVNANVTGQDFASVANPTYTIGGTITESGSGLGGVQVSATGGFTGSTTTAGDGTYTLSGVSPGATSIVLTPTLAGHTMTPTTRTVAGPVNANVTGQDFTSVANSGFLLTVNSTHGSVTKSPNLASYPNGTNVSVLVTPFYPYTFASWTGDVPAGHETDNPLTVTMNQDRTLIASFTSTGIGSDDFNRANETPLAGGGNWQVPFVRGTANLSAHHVVGVDGDAYYYWQGPGAIDNTHQFARATVIQPNEEVGLVLLGATNQALVMSWNQDGHVYIYWWLGAAWQGNLKVVPSTLQIGDIIEARLEGGIFYAIVNGATVTSVANTTSLTSGRPGLQMMPGGTLDDWSGGIPQGPVGVGTTGMTTDLRGVTNPTRGKARLDYSLAERGPVDLSIYSVDGRRVRTLVHDVQEAGPYTVTWNGADEHGAQVRAGVFFVRLSAPKYQRTRLVSFMR